MSLRRDRCWVLSCFRVLETVEQTALKNMQTIEGARLAAGPQGAREEVAQCYQSAALAGELRFRGKGNRLWHCDLMQAAQWRQGSSEEIRASLALFWSGRFCSFGYVP